jgi:2-methylisocitrate lyase-like PEP mutase family enzyme
MPEHRALSLKINKGQENVVTTQKNILPLDSYLEKLSEVCGAAKDMYVVARTDTSDENDIKKRVSAFQEFAIDCILVDGISSTDKIKSYINTEKFNIAFNQIHGGKSNNETLSDLKEQGVNIAIFSTPCLFTAMQAIERSLNELLESDYLLSSITQSSTLTQCSSHLDNNLNKRFKS